MGINVGTRQDRLHNQCVVFYPEIPPIYKLHEVSPKKKSKSSKAAKPVDPKQIQLMCHYSRKTKKHSTIVLKIS